MPLGRSLLAHGGVVGPSAGRLRLHLSLPIGGDECGGVPRSAQRSRAQTDAASSAWSCCLVSVRWSCFPRGSAIDVRQCGETGCGVRPEDPYQPALSDESLDLGESTSSASCCPRRRKWYWRAVPGAELRSIQVLACGTGIVGWACGDRRGLLGSQRNSRPTYRDRRGDRSVTRRRFT